MDRLWDSNSAPVSRAKAAADSDGLHGLIPCTQPNPGKDDDSC